MLVLFVIGFTSCNKDDETAPVKGYVINERFSSQLIGSWVFFSDKEGNPLKTYEVSERYQSIDYDFAKGEPYWATTVRQYSDRSVVLRTIQMVTNIDTLDFGYIGTPHHGSVSFGLTEGDAYLDISALKNVRNITIGSNGFASFTFPEYRTFTPFRLSSQSGENCYISYIPHIEEPMYALVQNVSKGDTLIPKIEDFKVYDSGFDYDHGTYSQHAARVIGIDNRSDNYCFFYTSSSNHNTTVDPVRYLNGFIKYETYLNHVKTENGDTKEVYYKALTDKPLNAYSIVDNDIKIEKVDEEQLKYFYNGNAVLSSWTWETFDLIGSDWSGNFWWLDTDVQSNGTFRRPSIPDEIRVHLPDPLDFRLTSVSFERFSFLKSYEEYVLYNAYNKSYPDSYNWNSEVLTNYEGLGD
ncbi:hypothetical protein GCM10009122_34710 [Fulvivirga kasyanovii]